MDRLWSITEDLNILYKENWTRLAAQEVQLFQVSHRFSLVFLFLSTFALFLIDFTHVFLCLTLSLFLSSFSSLSLQDTLLRAVRQSKVYQPGGVQMNAPTHKWTYASAFLYSLTLITTIGE